MGFYPRTWVRNRRPPVIAAPATEEHELRPNKPAWDGANRLKEPLINSLFVIPAKAGIHNDKHLDARLRGHDE